MDQSEKNRLVFFTTDQGYLIPSLVAARQVLDQSTVAAAADVIIFLVGFDDEDFESISRSLAPTGIRFLPLRPERYALPNNATFNETHVPQSALARLAVGDDVPTQYEHIVYLDGDIQITGDIAPLILHDVLPGRLLAAGDHAHLAVVESGGYATYFRQYLDGLGIEAPGDYFNSGVLAARRSTWIDLSRAALQFMRNNSAKCLYHDQSALNAVAYSHRELLSPKYNFVSWYADLGVKQIVNPAIIHFTGGAKPWVSDAPPWNGRFKSSYAALLHDYPFLNAYWVPKTQAEQNADDCAVRLKRRRTNRLLPLRPALRRWRARRYLRNTTFAVK